MRIHDAAVKVETAENLIPRGSSYRHITALRSKICELDSVCAKLQGKDRSRAEVMALFNAYFDKHPSMASHLQELVLNSSIDCTRQ